jgi:hypothetical protein
MNGFAPTPQHGAALRWVLTHFDVGNCSTPEILKEAHAFAHRISTWAAAQPEQHVRAVYAWAVTSFLKDCEERAKVFDNSRRVMAAFEDLPKPPDDIVA